MVTLDIETEVGGNVIGIDEAGRGPLAGGVYAAAVHVPLERARELLEGEWRAINDSKKLTPKKREELERVIKATEGCVWAVASASPSEIDELNILHATHLAMRRAAEQCIERVKGQGPRAKGEGQGPRVKGEGAREEGQGPRAKGEGALITNNSSLSTNHSSLITNHSSLSTHHSSLITILVDGLPVEGLPCPSRNVIKGDAKSLLIAAASILAKTARDADCLRLEAEYPGYGFAKHKGYPTKAHYEALARLGPCPEHRRSFRLTIEQESHDPLKHGRNKLRPSRRTDAINCDPPTSTSQQLNLL